MPAAPAVTAVAADRAGAFDLEIQAVRKRYGAFAAVDDLSFGVRQGSFFSILGPSGCGKTTLLRMIAGFIEPDAGDIRIKGASMNGVPPNKRPVNMVFQHLALFPMMTVGENIAYGLERRGVKGGAAKSKVVDMLRRRRSAGQRRQAHRPALGRTEATRGDRAFAGA